MQKVVYIGTSESIIVKIMQHPEMELQKVICEEKRVRENYKSTISSYNIPLETFVTKEQFSRIINLYEDIDVIFIIYQFDIIVPGNLTSRFRFFNFHAGSISTNRGAHPIIRSVLNGDKSSELTLHEIDSKIDQGIIVSVYPVKIENVDNPVTIKSKMEDGIIFLFEQLIKYLRREITGSVAGKGIYYKPISEKDYTIDLLTDSRETILNKIKSQVQYLGAIVHINDTKYNIIGLEELKFEDCDKNEILVSESSILVKRENDTFLLKLN